MVGLRHTTVTRVSPRVLPTAERNLLNRQNLDTGLPVEVKGLVEDGAVDLTAAANVGDSVQGFRLAVHMNIVSRTTDNLGRFEGWSRQLSQLFYVTRQ